MVGGGDAARPTGGAEWCPLVILQFSGKELAFSAGFAIIRGNPKSKGAYSYEY
jgi:hypothetical protein